MFVTLSHCYILNWIVCTELEVFPKESHLIGYFKITRHLSKTVCRQKSLSEQHRNIYDV